MEPHIRAAIVAGAASILGSVVAAVIKAWAILKAAEIQSGKSGWSARRILFVFPMAIRMIAPIVIGALLIVVGAVLLILR